MTDLAHPATDYSVVEREPPVVMERNLFVASRLWSSSLVFFFFAFLFAYFYLRTLDSHGLFKPKGVDAPQAWGAAVAICVVASAALLSWGAADQRADRRPLWRLKGVGALRSVRLLLEGWLGLSGGRARAARRRAHAGLWPIVR